MRMTKRDWQIINTALALLEADSSDEVTARDQRRIGQTRMKIHWIAERYSDFYQWHLDVG